MVKNSTSIPNSLFDKYLSQITPSETKILLVIFRKTLGWIDPVTKQRKSRDWISNSQFVRLTGMTDKTVSKALLGLIDRQLIRATNYDYLELKSPQDRQGKRVYYEPVFKPRKQECSMRINNQIEHYDKVMQKKRHSWLNQ